MDRADKTYADTIFGFSLGIVSADEDSALGQDIRIFLHAAYETRVMQRVIHLRIADTRDPPAQLLHRGVLVCLISDIL